MFIGVDLGTSAVKLLAMSNDGEILKTVSVEYPISFPKSGWSEQNPEDWYKETILGIKELIKDFSLYVKSEHMFVAAGRPRFIVLKY